MRDRLFGVELEFGNGNFSPGSLSEHLRRNGFNRFSGNIGRDGSGIELRTPVLNGTKDLKELKSLVYYLNEIGCYTTQNDGLHVHHDAPEFYNNKPMLVKLLKSWFENQSEIEKLIVPRRRKSGHCPDIQAAHISSFESRNWGTMKDNINYTLPRGNLNLKALNRHRTIELRYHEGTLDWDHIESWVRFGQSFLNGVVKRKRPLAKTDSPVILMNRLKTSKRAKEILIAKANSFTPQYA